jgi:hypothetical protein
MENAADAVRPPWNAHNTSNHNVTSIKIFTIALKLWFPTKENYVYSKRFIFFQSNNSNLFELLHAQTRKGAMSTNKKFLFVLLLAIFLTWSFPETLYENKQGVEPKMMLFGKNTLIFIFFFLFCVCMKAITKPILGAVIEIRVLKQTSAIYYFKVAWRKRNVKNQNKR